MEMKRERRAEKGEESPLGHSALALEAAGLHVIFCSIGPKEKQKGRFNFNWAQPRSGGQ
jgi:hypothetical protein